MTELFGKEWHDEMMKFKKAELIEMVKKRTKRVSELAEKERFLPITKQQLLDCGINVFAIDLLAESFLKLNGGPPDSLSIFFPIRRSDCEKFAGVNIRIEPVRK